MNFKVYNELKDLPLVSTVWKGSHKNGGNKHSKHQFIIFTLFVLAIALICIFVKYMVDISNKTVNGRVCEMFLYDGNMYYTNYGSTLYRYENSSGKGKVVSKLKIEGGSQVFEDKGYIYYSNGKAIYQRDMKNNTSKKLVTGENVWVDAVGGGRVFYHIAYKDSKGDGFSEFEVRIYELATGKDTVLFDRSEDMWQLLFVEGNTIIASANGLYEINPDSGFQKRIANLNAAEGILLNKKFYFNTYTNDEKGLWSVDINGDKVEEIPLPGRNEEGFFVDRITGSGDTLYVAAYYEDENHLIKVDLGTHDTTILATVQGRVWKLAADGKKLYSYETDTPADRRGHITVIPLK